MKAVSGITRGGDLEGVKVGKEKFDALLRKMLSMPPIQNDDLKLGKPVKTKPKKCK